MLLYYCFLVIDQGYNLYSYTIKAISALRAYSTYIAISTFRISRPSKLFSSRRSLLVSSYIVLITYISKVIPVN